MAVLKTTSPETRPVAPAEEPRKTDPSANARRAGAAAGTARGSCWAGCAERDRLTPVPLCIKREKVYRDSPTPSNSPLFGPLPALEAEPCQNCGSPLPPEARATAGFPAHGKENVTASCAGRDRGPQRAGRASSASPAR